MSLAAEMLLQRTRAQQVVPVYEEFARRYSAPQLLARESPAAFASVIAPLGLRWRAPLMMRTAGIVAERGNLPEQPAELERLPGVGPYAAAAYLSLHRGKRAVLVDANVVRWLGRMFAFPTHAETRRRAFVRELADLLTPRRSFRAYNYAVLDLAMTVCRRAPACDACPFRDGTCAYARAARERRASGAASRPAAARRRGPPG